MRLNKKKLVVFSAFALLLCCKANGQTYGHYYYTNDKGDTMRTIIDTTLNQHNFLNHYFYNCWCPPPDPNRPKPDPNSPFKWTKENGGFFYTDSLGNFLRPANLDNLDFGGDSLIQKNIGKDVL